MLPADVGAAPAATTRYQGSSSTPSAVRRERLASEADPFGELVDQFADDAEPSAVAGQRAARPAASQAAAAQPQAQTQTQTQAQALAPDAPAAGSPTPSVKSQPHPNDMPAGVASDPDPSDDDSRTDLVVPQLLTPFEPPLSVPAPATPAGSDTAVPDGDVPVARRGWPQPIAAAVSPASPTGAAPLVDAPRFEAPDLAAGETEAAERTGDVPLASLGLPEGMPPEAASPEVLAALRAVRAAKPSASSDTGAVVSATASSRAAQVVPTPGPTAPSDPRQAALHAVREALAQSVDGARTASTSPVVQPTAVEPHPPVLAHDRAAAPVAIDLAAQAPVTGVPADPLASPGTQGTPGTASATAPPVAAEQIATDAASVRLPRTARPASGQPQPALSQASLNAMEPVEETAEATPTRKGAPDEAPLAVARPTARAAQAIAAFHAAAAIGATTTPAAVNGAVVGAAVSSTPLLDAELPTQLIHAIRVQFEQGSGEARIRLNPGFLGGVTVGVQIDGSSVTASLQAASADVREWMRTNESVLRQALADQGLQLDRLVIVDEDAPASGDGHDARPREEREQQAPRRQRRTADQGTFELVF